MEVVKQNKAAFDSYRAKYPDFSYVDYSWVLNGGELRLSFTYAFSEEDIFTTVLSLSLPGEVSNDDVRVQEDVIFRIGLIEALSYWKAYCSPRLRIMCGTLSESEVSWWADTWYDGTGEFRYRNGLLEVPKGSWVEFVFDSKKTATIPTAHDFSKLAGNLIAFTGGKDSTLALGLLADAQAEGNELFFVKAPSPSRDLIKEVLGATNYPETIIMRKLDEKLLLLNEKGALNGHTPFSIVVAFISMLTASLRGKKYVIVANEASAEQPTVPGTDINHQYSKSLHFERRFQAYCRALWPDGPEYFSMLRPLSEIGIIVLLKKYEAVMPFISSCNKADKKGLWCGTCAKCLFAFMLVSAEWDVAFAVHIFGSNMFEHVENLTMLEELSGLTDTRPFECVGTTQESLAVLSQILAQSPETKRLPLLETFLKRHEEMLLPSRMYKAIACEFHEHAIPDPACIELLERAQDEVCYG